jgi:hypothetical protein
MKGYWLGPVKHIVNLELTTQHSVQQNFPVHTEHCVHTRVHLVEEQNDGLQIGKLTIIFNTSYFVMFLTFL